ncbi:MAG: hypothetical protein EAZ73_22880 [Oscillatoriales cyanobacterium]|nr:MAG: hypothetical protein EAZ83_21490 [Oscillatoriales cyanobacterium]TAF16971.1 MAG: hypothetical protein EAZ73_22880 [Oscillatoriales cyanobacterium]
MLRCKLFKLFAFQLSIRLSLRSIMASLFGGLKFSLLVTDARSFFVTTWILMRVRQLKLKLTCEPCQSEN